MKGAAALSLVPEIVKQSPMQESMNMNCIPEAATTNLISESLFTRFMRAALQTELPDVTPHSMSHEEPEDAVFHPLCMHFFSVASQYHPTPQSDAERGQSRINFGEPFVALPLEQQQRRHDIWNS
tara:strand:- start:275 stop:649 length:375 start_codon:yes stop_codon:yes gene_type:complete